MRTIERQLGGLVTRKLGSGNAFGEFDNADGDDFSNAGGKARRQARRDARNARKSGGCDDVTKDTPLYGLSFCVKGAPIYPSLTTVATLADWKKKIVLLHPNMKPEQISVMEGRIRSELTTGSFYSKFVNKDGTFHVEAASNLYPLAYFSDFTGAWMERGKIAAEKSTHEILDNGGKAKTFNRTAEPTKANDGKKMLDVMFAGGKKKATYSLNKDN